jgi:hypothetical protein
VFVTVPGVQTALLVQLIFPGVSIAAPEPLEVMVALLVAVSAVALEELETIAALTVRLALEAALMVVPELPRVHSPQGSAVEETLAGAYTDAFAAICTLG